MENGNSIEYLKRNPDADRMRILREVASGVDYLHTCSSNVIHGDLRGVSSRTDEAPLILTMHHQVNVLISASGRARISDFGLSKVRLLYIIGDGDSPCALIGTRRCW